MHQNDHSLLTKMNVQSDAIIINQCERDEIERFTFRGKTILWISCLERGVGLSRNTALSRATADILYFSDDDVVFHDGYEKIVVSQFQKNPKASFIIFNVKCTNTDRQEKEIIRSHRLRFYNSMTYGAYRFAIRKSEFYHKRVFFSQLFGGGCPYSAGEDNLFVMDALRAKLKVYSSSCEVGIVTHADSTWFEGYTDKYFIDFGHLYYSLFGIWAWLWGALVLIKNHRMYSFPLNKGLYYMNQGILEEKRL